MRKREREKEREGYQKQTGTVSDKDDAVVILWYWRLISLNIFKEHEYISYKYIYKDWYVCIHQEIETDAAWVSERQGDQKQWGTVSDRTVTPLLYYDTDAWISSNIFIEHEYISYIYIYRLISMYACAWRCFWTFEFFA